jgi:hypothetical protein
LSISSFLRGRGSGVRKLLELLAIGGNNPHLETARVDHRGRVQ